MTTDDTRHHTGQGTASDSTSNDSPNQPRWVEFDGETFSVDAALIADDLGIGPAHVQPLMRAGKITSRCERGIDQDAGHYRLTFFHDARRLQLVVDGQGQIVTRHAQAFALRDRRAPGSRRLAWLK